MGKLIRHIEMEDFKKVLKAEKEKKFKLAYALGAGSGLRISEIVGLKEELSRCHKAEIITSRELVDGKKLKVHRCKECGAVLSQKDMIRGTKWKIPPLTSDKIDLEKHQIRVFGKRGKERIAQTSPWLNKTNIQMLPLNIPRRTLQDRFPKLCKKVLGKVYNFHCLRHTYGNYMINDKETPATIIQSLMGHSDLSTTGMYAKANPKKAVETAWENF